MSVGVRGSILHGFEFKKVEVLWKCLCKILFKLLTNMFKTGHPTYTQLPSGKFLEYIN